MRPCCCCRGGKPVGVDLLPCCWWCFGVRLLTWERSGQSVRELSRRCPASGVLVVVEVGRGPCSKRSVCSSCAVPLTSTLMKDTKTLTPIGRKALREALDTVPLDSLFSPAVSKELTGKQKRFAREVAMGATKVDAYRRSYNAKSPHTLTSKPYHLAADDRVKAEIEAIKRAIAAQEYQTPAALRALVIQSLVGVITNPDSQPGQITAAAKVLGTVTEVAAFTERKEVRTITSSEDARAKIMAELKQLTAADVEDVTAIDLDADSLLAELAQAGADVDSELDATHPYPTPQTVESESPANIHTIPHEQSAIPHEQSHSAATPTDDRTKFWDDYPTPPLQDDPPSSS